MKIRVITTLVFIFFVLLVSAKEKVNDKNEISYDSTLVHIEKQISELAKQLFDTRRNDAKSTQISNEIVQLFVKAYENEEAYKYPFDSIFPVGKIQAIKGEFKIFTWNIVLKTGEYKYFGFLSYQNKEIKKSMPLLDCSTTITEELVASLDNENWYGANYYEVVEAKNQAGTHYLLLGWKGYDLHSTKKVIETLYFTKSGMPKFGKSLLKIERKKYKRLIFEYSRMADMMLEYNEDYGFIVFDHLSPSSGVQAGDYQFYGPDLSYDAFKYNGDFWEYKSAIDYKRLPDKKRKKK